VTATAGTALGAAAVGLVIAGATVVVVGATVVVVVGATVVVVVGASAALGASVVLDDVRTKRCLRCLDHDVADPATRSAPTTNVAITAFATSLRRLRRCARASLSRSDLDVIRSCLSRSADHVVSEFSYDSSTLAAVLTEARRNHGKEATRHKAATRTQPGTVPHGVPWIV
jgi:hypothetical protein